MHFQIGIKNVPPDTIYNYDQIEINEAPPDTNYDNVLSRPPPHNLYFHQK